MGFHKKNRGKTPFDCQNDWFGHNPAVREVEVEVADPHSCFSSTIPEFRNVHGFLGEKSEKPLGARDSVTNNKLNPHMASTPGCVP